MAYNIYTLNLSVFWHNVKAKKATFSSFFKMLVFRFFLVYINNKENYMEKEELEFLTDVFEKMKNNLKENWKFTNIENINMRKDVNTSYINVSIRLSYG